MTARRIVAAAAVLLLAASSAAAQARRVPHEGEEVIVQPDTAGAEIRGRLIDLSSESVSILTRAGRVELPLEEIARIDTTRDSLLNGAVIGAFVAGGWCAFVCGQGLDSGSPLPVVLANAGLGALSGAGIDSAHKGRKPIYVRSPQSGGAVLIRLRF